MNKPIRRVSVFCLLLVLALMIRANWVQGVDASALNANAHNERTLIEAYSYPRGDIIVGGKAVTKDLLVNGNLYKYRRAYVNGPMYAPITGYSSQVFGSNLLENVEDPILSGNDPRLFFRNALDTLTGKQKQGGDVVTTIDPKVQQAGWDGLQGKKGAAVALDPSTGAILGLVSFPSYDPSTIAGANGDANKAWNALVGDKTNQPMLNRALRQTYPPGSTFKLVTAAAALENGNITDINAPTDTPDVYILPGTNNVPLPNEAGDTGCKNASLNTALALSCNTVFGKLGAEIGGARMLDEAQKFGFNNSSLTVPVGVTGSNFDKGMGQAQTAQSSIGQYDTRATPLQMAMVAAAIANNGSLMQPYLVSQERSANNSVISQWSPKQLSQATTPEVAAQIQTMMINVVQNGTGITAKIPGVTVGGKTGTAQNGVNNSNNPYAWFVSWAKAPNGKQIAVAVVVEDSDTARGDISGMHLAAPIAKAMMQAYIGG
ncbi:peptidoglycan D,D-transpeptidase FtsI family protein [Streptacidiphilus jiangxiensis]|uniref:Cell division protein FtsI/penicillin-binding protein 2 n=1 Tax=Streptacidiphilus jiangxiensis TaxID=235985 RepID=A0A1H7JHS0_STRJI|nr:penicillin-binding protein 2 [Streptacidiphilus jiangxiensis]SEK72975.1 Cell division protein FtsI/penicillin-binding protein 2 [Streptacidiphilus jiangxiensis]